MSGFVPLKQTGSFNAGLIGSMETPIDTSERATATSGPADVGAVSEEEDQLPRSIEELELLLEEAREQARVDAEAALVSVRASLEAERAQVALLCDQVSAARTNWTNEVRNVLGELVVVGVRQVVSESADLQTELIRDRLAEVGERLLSEQHVVLRVRPEDEELARSVIGNREGWQIIPDSDLSGGVLAETEGGKVDATLGSAITGLTEAVQVWQGEGVGEE